MSWELVAQLGTLIVLVGIVVTATVSAITEKRAEVVRARMAEVKQYLRERDRGGERHGS